MPPECTNITVRGIHENHQSFAWGTDQGITEKNQLSQEQLAEKIQIDAKNLSRIEVGRGYPSLDTLDKIANALGVEIRDFFDFQHLESTNFVSNSIESIVKSASEEELRMLLRLAKVLIR